MRPCHSAIDCSAEISHSEAGLPHTPRVDYNHRQDLPVRDSATRRALPQCQRREPVMKSSRPDSPSPKPVETGHSEPKGRSPESRAERLARIRREIAAGTYETQEKLEAAIDRLIGVLAD